MKRFSQLFEELDASNRTTEKVDALKRYFLDAPAEDAAWALFFLTGNRLPASVNTRLLRAWVGEIADIPAWLVDECYGVVGDLAETLAHLLPVGPLGVEAEGKSELGLRQCSETILQPLKDLPEGEKRARLVEAWSRLNGMERFVFNKLLTGGFRVGVQRTLVTRALGRATGVDPAVLAHRLMGNWRPSMEDYQRLCDPDEHGEDPQRPYPFYLAYPLEERSTSKAGGEKELPDFEALLGPVEEWQVEWKYDGIRAQLLKRKGRVMLWSRGEELMTDRYPEVVRAGLLLPEGMVLDGEILAWREGKPLGFGTLQKRIGRKQVSDKLLVEAPTAFIAYDCLEFEGEDIRDRPLADRRNILEQVIQSRKDVLAGVPLLEKEQSAQQMELEDLFEEERPGSSADASVEPRILLSELVVAGSWSDFVTMREESRARKVEGFMIKRKLSPYGVRRTKGDWWKWKVDPFTIDAVMVYAQAGHGRRAGLFTDFTFAVWKDSTQEELLPVCKAYSGLTDAEFEEINGWINRNSLGRHGPVRVVKAEQVFEIAFEGINRSGRHKSGIAFRFPRMSRWRKDKPVKEIDSLHTIEGLID